MTRALCILIAMMIMGIINIATYQHDDVPLRAFGVVISFVFLMIPEIFPNIKL